MVLVKGDLQRTLLTPDLRPADQARGLPLGQRARGGAAQLPPGLRRARRSSSRRRWCSAPGPSSTPRPGRSPTSSRAGAPATRPQANQAAEAARKLSAKRGDSHGAPEAARRQRPPAGHRQVHPGHPPARAALRAHADCPSIDSPDFVSTLVFDTREGAKQGRVGVPKSRFAYLFPSPRLRADPGAAQAGPDRRRARPRDRPDQGGQPPTSRCKPQRGARYVVSGVPVVVEGLADEVRSAIFVLLGAALLVMAATLALVFRTPAAAAAAGARAGGRGDDLRRAGARGRGPDDGVDRGAARADRLGGGLLDPVPGAPRRGASRAAATGARRPRAPRRPAGPTIATAGVATAVGLPRAAAVAGADGARLRGAGGGRHRAGAGVRAHRRVRRAGALRGRPAAPDVPPVFPRAARARTPWRAGAISGGAARLRARWRKIRLRGAASAASGPRRTRCPPAARAGGRPGRGDRRAGRWTPRARWSPTCASWCRATSRR